MEKTPSIHECDELVEMLEKGGTDSYYFPMIRKREDKWYLQLTGDLENSEAPISFCPFCSVSVKDENFVTRGGVECLDKDK